MTSSIYKLALLISTGLIMVSCVSDRAYRDYSNQKYPPNSIEDVEVVFEIPQRDYEVLADFQAKGNMELAVKKFQKEAATIGADGIYVKALGGAASFSQEWASKDNSISQTRITATAYKYKE